ncbi:hypothetical protein C7B62_12780 [Pleurocapsa sp. CCALA 161]|uniref:DUF4347 domain-containing protein n=1 Tax=Pleurocapsa sp. CCALA 161 TaxID=2107688 RepID=UPI000D054E04|nr:DUF4347 domain-containing protein [Pleurocapsa sp. CCALA 161]PSB09561.1 hypothetical protein C7B62_12780 [Pleurocapsa sp. CCALA 161]
MFDSLIHLNFNNLQLKDDLLFIDSAIENYQSLIDLATPSSEIVILDSLQNGIEQISKQLAQYHNLESIQIVSHGQAGSVQFGNSQLNLDTLDFYDEQIKNWGNALSEKGDILFYGCNVAIDQDGKDLIQELSDITGADIAASKDLTGNSALGGNWDLEIQTGKIESARVFPPEVTEVFEGILHSDDALIDEADATHVAITNGSWFDPNTWQNGKLPTDGAQVLIPEGIRVNYTQESNNRLYTLRVDGTLNFSSKSNTKMLVDTLFVASEGKLFIGNLNNPIQANKTAQIIFTSDKAIDTQWDTEQLSRGLISQGKVQIYGADKLDFVALKKDVLAGERELILNLPTGTNTPQGWQVGDQLVLGGTSYNNKGSDRDNSRFQDEVLTITAIDGNKISFTNNDIAAGDNQLLRFDHKRPDGYKNRLNLYVANTTRNVSFETENGDSVPVNHRGHVMFMHNPNVVVQNAGFYNLGRTDKNKLIDDPSQNVDGTKGSGTNPRGRYSLHFHRTGADDWNGSAAIAKGNAVVGSPGWGIAHHDSHVNIEYNVVFDVVGTGIAAEAGNEIGTWRNNITIKTTGDDSYRPDLEPSSKRVNRFDFGFNGEGYWVQGAGQIDIVDNIAISAESAGIVHYGGGDGGQQVRDAQTIAVKNLPSQYQSLAKGTGDESVIDVSAVPLRKLSGFESYNSRMGMNFWATLKNLDNQLEIDGATASSKPPAHNFHSQVKDFKVWNNRSAGVSFIYASQVDLKNGLIVGNRLNPKGKGIVGNSGSMNNNFANLYIDGFEYGLQIPFDQDQSRNNSSITNVTFAHNIQNFNTRKFNDGTPTGYSSYFEIVNSKFNIVENNTSPTAKFTHKTLGGFAVQFDASDSFDTDSSEKNLDGKGIVSYGWDFDNDGRIDKFGRQVGHYFNSAGDKNITLTVWDNQGATQTLTQTINLVSQAYENLIVDGNFNSSNDTKDFSSAAANQGWSLADNWTRNSQIGNGGAATVSKNMVKGIGQSVFDEGMRRGNQTLTMNIKNTEGNNNLNQLTVTVWGVNGEFRNSAWDIQGPQQVGTLPMKRKQLLQKTVGGDSFDWKNFSWDLNFGNGYEFIVFQANSKGIDPNKGDILAIDNISIK